MRGWYGAKSAGNLSDARTTPMDKIDKDQSEYVIRLVDQWP
jgi:hypothetical protein